MAHTCCACMDTGRLRVGVPLGEEGFGKTALCECRRHRPDSPPAFKARSRIPAIHTDSRIGSWLPADGEPRQAAEGYVVDWPPARPLLVLTGNTGTGKTHLAVGILWALRAQHSLSGQFWPVVALLDRYRATFDENATERVESIDAELARMPLLVIDDLGTQKSSEWAQERLFRLIDLRYAEKLPLVITTNLAVDALPGRIGSRLSHPDVSTVVKFKGADHRLARAKGKS